MVISMLINQQITRGWVVVAFDLSILGGDRLLQEENGYNFERRNIYSS